LGDGGRTAVTGERRGSPEPEVFRFAWPEAMQNRVSSGNGWHTTCLSGVVCLHCITAGMEKRSFSIPCLQGFWSAGDKIICKHFAVLLCTLPQAIPRRSQ